MKKIIISGMVLLGLITCVKIIDAQNIKIEKENLFNQLSLTQTQNVFEASNNTISVFDYVVSDNIVSIENDLIDLTVVGEHEITVKISDFVQSSGEEVSKYETIDFVVEDTIAPSIEVDDFSIYAGSTPSYKVLITDTHCETDYIIDDSSVDYEVSGTYTARVVATDECGNVAEKEFNVVVLPTEKTWIINTTSSSYGSLQSTIDRGLTASCYSSDGTKWVFKHATMGGSQWYAMKPGDTLILDGVSYKITNSTTAYEPDNLHLYLNGVDIFDGGTANSGHKVVLKTCYSGTTNWVITAD